MIILGLHSGHDGSVSVVVDGRLVASVAHERLSRKRQMHGYTPELIDYVLGIAGVSVEQIDVIALSDWNPRFANDSLAVTRDGVPVAMTWDTFFGNDYGEFVAELRGRRLPAVNVGHHICHAAAAFYTSPFDRAHLFTMDASGGHLAANSFRGFGAGNRLAFAECPGLMVGLAYGQICERLGIGSQATKAGAMMGLAAYGDLLPVVAEQLERMVGEAFFTVEMAYWAWVERLWLELSGRTGSFAPAEADQKPAMDIAHSMQHLFEECILDVVRRLPDNGTDQLCLGGGSFLNCGANSRIVRDGRFRQVHHFPACGDDGGSAGAALYVAHHIYDEPRHRYDAGEVAYLGVDHGRPDVDLDRVVQAIIDGKVVGWLQGRMEVGPRALGGSSLLADPRSPTMREHLNKTVKRREWFRPFAPAVLEERCSEWFDWDQPSPYMLFTARVLRPDLIPAVTHVDDTSRMQTVSRSSNPLFYELIDRFYRRTGVPMLLNTSFNGPGEPIIVDAEQARARFAASPIDILVADGAIVSR